ncbi:hypothetical protein BZA77DRAFT_322841 [Pyronema omphalodes]|nr:hypothetical protein BZA77DRAFT_322841 [Pyronema omphalodes]
MPPRTRPDSNPTPREMMTETSKRSKHSTSPPAPSSRDSNTNASRLRDNQRRSRLRKKEYLASLETKFQECQRAGVEASVEVQTAAKRVIRENIRLRELLRSKGVTDAEINGFLRGSENTGSAFPVDDALRALSRRPCDSSSGDCGSEKNGKQSCTSIVQPEPQKTIDTSSNYQCQCKSQIYQSTQQHTDGVTQIESPISAIELPLQQSPPLPVTPPGILLEPQRSSISPIFPAATAEYRQNLPQHDPYSFNTIPNPSPAIYQTPHAVTPQFSPPHPTQHQEFINTTRMNDCNQGSVPCDIARSMIMELAHEEGVDVLTREFCPQGPSQGCMVNTGILFSVMDRTCG